MGEAADSELGEWRWCRCWHCRATDDDEDGYGSADGGDAGDVDVDVDVSRILPIAVFS